MNNQLINDPDPGEGWNWKKREYPKNDYLKFFGPIKKFVGHKYDLTSQEIDMLLFLFSEKYFKRADFDKFRNLVSWDKKRFDKMLREKYIQVWRKPIPSKRLPLSKRKTTGRATLYCLSNKGRSICHYIYRVCNGEAVLPKGIPGKKTFSKKVLRNYIRDVINPEIKQKTPLV